MIPRVSVIVPVYNAKICVEECVRSVLTQTYETMEVILVNDGSTDGSLELCRKIARTDDRVILIDQPNSGPNAARNSGLQAAKGEFVIFVDADDELYSSDTIALNMRHFVESPEIDIVSFPQYREQKDGSLQTKEAQFSPRVLTDKLEMFTNWFNGRLIDGGFPGKIFRKSLFDGWKLIETIRFTEDHYDIPNICRCVRAVQISGEGGYVYKYNPQSAIHSEYTVDKRRGQLYSELNIYRYLCELDAPMNYKKLFYNKAVENAYYLYLTKHHQESVKLLSDVHRCMQGGSPLVKGIKYMSIVFGLKIGLRVSNTIATVALKYKR